MLWSGINACSSEPEPIVTEAPVPEEIIDAEARDDHVDIQFSEIDGYSQLFTFKNYKKKS